VGGSSDRSPPARLGFTEENNNRATATIHRRANIATGSCAISPVYAGPARLDHLRRRRCPFSPPYNPIDAATNQKHGKARTHERAWSTLNTAAARRYTAATAAARRYLCQRRNAQCQQQHKRHKHVLHVHPHRSMCCWFFRRSGMAAQLNLNPSARVPGCLISRLFPDLILVSAQEACHFGEGHPPFKHVLQEQ
jgi:hypothetical protein